VRLVDLRIFPANVATLLEQAKLNDGIHSASLSGEPQHQGG
jgi:hypothetical protein